MWFLLAVIALFSQSIFWILARSILKERIFSAIAFAIYFDLLLGLILLPIAFLNGFALPPLHQIWVNLVLMIILYGIIDIFTYLSLKHTPISEFIIIRATIPVWTALASIPILHESAHLPKIIGIILCVVGAFIVYYNNKKIHLHQGHLFAFLAAVFYGFSFTNDAILLHHFNSVTYSSLFFMLPAFFISAIYPGKLLEIKYFLRMKIVIKIILAAIPLAIYGLATNTSYKLGGEISRISTIVQLSSILTLILGVFILKEKEHTVRKLIGGIIVVIVILLIQMK